MYPSAWVVGPAFPCACEPGDNLALHSAIATSPPGYVLVCDAAGDEDHGFFGELMAVEALRRGLIGLVIDGAVRDLNGIENSGLPVFARSTNPFPTTKAASRSVGDKVNIGNVSVEFGDVLVADRDAVLVLDRASWSSIEQKVREIQNRETTIRSRLAEGQPLFEQLGIAFERSSPGSH